MKNFRDAIAAAAAIPHKDGPDFSEVAEGLEEMLEDEGCELGWGTLSEVAIDYLLDGGISHDTLVHRFKCSAGRASRIISLLNQATGFNAPLI
jgi:hypothetical protein